MKSTCLPAVVAAAFLMSSLSAMAFQIPLQFSIQRLSLPTNDLVYDSNTKLLYASVPSRAGVGIGNTITAINPFTGNIVSSTFIGSEPNKLALAGNGSVLYAGLDGAAAIRRFDVSSSTAGLQFPLGSDPFLGPFFAEDIAVLPGSPGSVAVSRRNFGFSPRHEGVAIYDNGVQRPQTTPDHTGSNVIEFGDSAGILYGYNNETTDFGFRTMSVTTSGVNTISTTANLITNFGVDIRYDDGLIYASSGRVIDPLALSLVGTYSLSPFGTRAFTPDSDSGLTFFVDGLDHLVIFDLDTFVPLDTFELPDVDGFAGSLVRFGENGLAFRTSGDQVFLLNVVPEPSTWALMLAGLALVGSRGRCWSRFARRRNPSAA